MSVCFIVILGYLWGKINTCLLTREFVSTCICQRALFPYCVVTCASWVWWVLHKFNKFGKFDEGRLDHYMKNVLFYINQLPQICKFCQIRQIKLTIYLLKSTHLPNTFVEKNETCLTKFGQVMSKSGEYCVNGHYLCKTL